MGHEFFEDKIGHNIVKVVCLNENISTNDALNMCGVVYVQIPDAPLKLGQIKVNIGHTLAPLRKRIDWHLFDDFGNPKNKTDISISRDIDDTMYIKVLESGLMTKEDALRAENLFIAQYAYDVTTFSSKPYMDIFGLLHDYPHEFTDKMYNQRITKSLYGSQYMGTYDYKDIINGKYSVIKGIEDDLFRIGVIKQKIAI